MIALHSSWQGVLPSSCTHQLPKPFLAAVVLLLSPGPISLWKPPCPFPVSFTGEQEFCQAPSWALRWQLGCLVPVWHRAQMNLSDQIPSFGAWAAAPVLIIDGLTPLLKTRGCLQSSGPWCSCTSPSAWAEPLLRPCSPP